MIAALSALKRLNFNFFKCIISGGIITAVEFAFGCIFNLWLGLNVWDYSDVPYNVLGQICPKFFSAFGFAVGALALLLGKGYEQRGFQSRLFMFSKFTLGKTLRQYRRQTDCGKQSILNELCLFSKIQIAVFLPCRQRRRARRNRFFATACRLEKDK